MIGLLRSRSSALVCATAFVSVTHGCLPDLPSVDGTCVVEPQSVVDCRVPGYDAELRSAGLVGYSCTGEARPDFDATSVEGVPQGIACADMGPLEDSGDAAYCCTEDTTPCAYDGSVECNEGGVGYQCWGNNRPESLNPAMVCSNGTNEHGLVRYCCTGQLVESGCQQSSAVGCGDRLMGFLCETGSLPRGEDLGSNQSRADYYYPTCDTATEAPNPDYVSHCCYMPRLVPIGSTCVNHTEVPGCDSGRFGFACYGPDHPEDSYGPMDCPDPGLPGRSREGWEATLYCCDFK